MVSTESQKLAISSPIRCASYTSQLAGVNHFTGAAYLIASTNGPLIDKTFGRGDRPSTTMPDLHITVDIIAARFVRTGSDVPSLPGMSLKIKK